MSSNFLFLQFVKEKKIYKIVFYLLRTQKRTDGESIVLLSDS